MMPWRQSSRRVCFVLVLFFQTSQNVSCRVVSRRVASSEFCWGESWCLSVVVGDRIFLVDERLITEKMSCIEDCLVGWMCLVVVIRMIENETAKLDKAWDSSSKCRMLQNL